MEDPGYKAYRVKAVKIYNKLEIDRENYYDLLKEKGLLNIVPPKPEVTQADLVEAVKSLADSTGKHASATEAQAKAVLHHHQMPELPMPIFNPFDCKGNPLAWNKFWQRFEIFIIDCVDDKSKLGFLLSAVKGDAYNIIKNLKCTDAKFQCS